MASTKEKITATALALFAQRGYDGVSVRDICKQVGIKAVSYTHLDVYKRQSYNRFQLRISNPDKFRPAPGRHAASKDGNYG